MRDNDRKVLNNMKALAIDMITEANSGHPGIVLSAAPLIHTLFSRYLIVNPNDPAWFNRDRLVFSPGHGSALLYSAMFMAGFHYTLDDMKQYRKLDSRLPGHPEIRTPGIDATTGPLGQGAATAVGMAIAEMFLENYFIIKDKAKYHTLFDYYTYVVCSDGDLMEGVTNEAFALAGNLGLGRLIALYDANQMTSDGPTSLTTNENLVKKFEAMNWHVQEVNGSDIRSIDKAIKRARLELKKPSLIISKTIIGKDSLLEGTKEAHGTPLTKEQAMVLKDRLELNNIPFSVSKESVAILQKSMVERNIPLYGDFQTKYDIFKKHPDFKELVDQVINKNLVFDISTCEFAFELENREPMRDVNGKVFNAIAKGMKLMLSTSADVFNETKMYIEDGGDFGAKDRIGRNIWCGVREHAMAAIMNGITLSGIRVAGSTMLVYSDYMKPAIRMAAQMQLPVIYTFTHDSFEVGEEGPALQPVEQLSMLREIPNLRVYRPADVNEIIGSWNSMLKDANHPSALIISKSKVNRLPYGNSKGVERGAYLVRKETTSLSGVIIATGTEVQDAVMVADRLFGEKGIDLRVISMPCTNIFTDQTEEYRQALLPKGYRVIVIESSKGGSWHPFVQDPRDIVSIESFGQCGNKHALKTKYGFDIDGLMQRVETIVKR